MEYQGLTLDRFQEEAIRHVDADRSVLVSAPTGTGKTLIADYIVEKALSENKEVIYTAPSRRSATRSIGTTPGCTGTTASYS